MDFCTALEKGDKNLLNSFSKIDIHNHAGYSCPKKYLIEHNIVLPNEPINNIATMNDFCRNYINPIQYDYEGLKMLLNGHFENCINTGIKIVAPSVDYKVCIRIFNNDINKFIEFLKMFSYDDLKILWDLGISRDSYKEEYAPLILDLIKTKYFSGIDLYATENSLPNSLFIKFYNLANELGLITKVHAGEQLGADYIKECIIDFNPKQIQHGIHIIEDENVMKLAKEKNIIFNICPTSNIVLGYVKDIKNHPIKKMVEYGLLVTIGTDDLLFFNSNINEEYLKLYNAGVLTPKQLNEIREFGLTLFN